MPSGPAWTRSANDVPASGGGPAVKTCLHGYMIPVNPATSGRCPRCHPRPAGMPATVFVRPADRVRAEDEGDPDDLEALDNEAV